jgi:hypothetical protein
VHTGSCHCGAVRFEVDADLERETIHDCNCSICTKKGFLHLIVSKDRFRLVAGEERLSTYTFGTGVAKHRFCSNCGICPFYTPRSHPDGVDVNVRCLDGVDLARLRTEPFDGRNGEADIARLRASE